MNGIKKVFLALFSIVLLGSLLGTAGSTSAVINLTKPKNIENWLSNSKLYDHFVSNATEQGQKSVGATEDANVTSLSDAAVQDAAKSAFSQALIESNVNKFIDSNYDWLEGKTDKPSFVIDLTSAKQSFAEQVGAYVTQHLTSLPACTDLPSAQAQAADPLNATCRPPSLSPQAAGAQVTQQIASSTELLNNPVLTAQNINPEQGSQNKPYYIKLAHLPKVYQYGKLVPIVLAALSLISTLFLIYLSSSRRRGFGLVGVIFAIAGVLLIIMKFSSDFVFKQAENRVFNNSTTGQLQQSLTSFAHQLEDALLKIDLYFGIAFLLIALMIFIILRINKKKINAPNVPANPVMPEPSAPAPQALPKTKSRPTSPDRPATPPRPKKPRLIQ